MDNYIGNWSDKRQNWWLLLLIIRNDFHVVVPEINIKIKNEDSFKGKASDEWSLLYSDNTWNHIQTSEVTFLESLQIVWKNNGHSISIIDTERSDCVEARSIHMIIYYFHKHR